MLVQIELANWPLFTVLITEQIVVILLISYNYQIYKTKPKKYWAKQKSPQLLYLRAPFLTHFLSLYNLFSMWMRFFPTSHRTHLLATFWVNLIKKCFWEDIISATSMHVRTIFNAFCHLAIFFLCDCK